MFGLPIGIQRVVLRCLATCPRLLAAPITAHCVRNYVSSAVPAISSARFSTTATKAIIQPGISLLYEKSVLKKDDAKSRRLQNRLENPRNGEDRACILRLSYLMEGDVHSNTVPSGVDLFCWDKFPGYDRSVEWDFLRSPIARVQRDSGASFAHAPIVLQHYLRNRYLSKNDPSKLERRSLDFLRLVREHFSADQIRKYIFEKDEGGESAFSLLGDIVLPRSRVDGGVLHLIGEQMQLFGPALITFDMHEDFHTGTKRQYFGKPAGRFVAGHAVVGVATRQEEGRTIVLIQNWWKSKQWVEMDTEYIANCNALVWFVTTPQSTTREELDKFMFGAVFTESQDGPSGHETCEGPWVCDPDEKRPL